MLFFTFVTNKMECNGIYNGTSSDYNKKIYGPSACQKKKNQTWVNLDRSTATSCQIYKQDLNYDTLGL